MTTLPPPRRLATLAPLTWLLAAVTLGGCGGASAPGAAGPPGPTASLSGVVTGPATAGVTIELTGPAQRSAVTDAAGAYALDGLPAGTYEVRASLAPYGFVPPVRTVTLGTAAAAGQDFESVAPSVRASAFARGATRVRVQWTPHGLSPTSYDVFRSATPKSLGAAILTGLPGTTTSFDDEGLAAGGHYLYTVRAASPGGPVLSAPVEVTTAAAPLATAAVEGTTVTVEWDQVPGAVRGYDVYRTSVGGACGYVRWGWELVASGVFTTAQLDVAPPGGVQTWVVDAVGASGDPVATMRTAPELLPLEVFPGLSLPTVDPCAENGAGVFHFAWFGNPAFPPPHVLATPTITSAAGRVQLDGPPHDLQVRVLEPGHYAMDIPHALLVSLFGDGAAPGIWPEAWTTAGPATRLGAAMGPGVFHAPPPSTAPAGLEGSVRNPTQVALSWQPVAGASGYQVYRLPSSASSIAGASPVATVAGTSLLDGGLPPNTDLYYRVTAVTSGGASPASDYLQVRTLSAQAPVMLPPVPVGAYKAVLSWLPANAGLSFRLHGGCGLLHLGVDPAAFLADLPPSPWVRLATATPETIVLTLLTAGTVPIVGDYRIAEVYPDGSEGPHSAAMPFPYF